VIVSDARAKLATTERFPDADRIIQGWPDETLEHVEILPNTYVAILSHDPKFDEPALLGTSTPCYIGFGSRSGGRRRLCAAGMSRAGAPGSIGLISAPHPGEMQYSRDLPPPCFGWWIADARYRPHSAKALADGNRPREQRQEESPAR
jgi:hypothetical protein